jgi:hypothetical protein
MNGKSERGYTLLPGYYTAAPTRRKEEKKDGLNLRAPAKDFLYSGTGTHWDMKRSSN